MRKQYYFRPSPTGNGYFAWDVDRLIELTKNLQPNEIDIQSIKELDEPHWFGDESDSPTCRNIIRHAELMAQANLTYPIILSEEGRVMDGMHRVGKAILEGKTTITAVQFERDPDPDYKDVLPEDLPY